MKIKHLFFLMIGLMMQATAWLGAQGTLQKEEIPLIPRRLLFGNPEKTSPELSPDGGKLAYLAPDAQNVLNVFIDDLKGGPKGRQITTDQKRGVRSFLWHYDHSHILYMQDKEGDENWHLYRTDIVTGETVDLTPFDGVRAAPLKYDPRFPDRMLISLNKRKPALFDVYSLNLKTGTLTLIAENEDQVYSWEADHDMEVRLALSFLPDGSTLIRLRDSQGSWKEFLTLPADEVDPSVVGFTPDNQAFYLISSLDGDTARLLEVNISTGQRKVIAEDSRFDLGSVMVHPTKKTLEAVGYDKEKFEWEVLDPAIKPDFEFLTNTFKGPFRIASRDLANQNWIIASQSDQRPAHFYAYNRAAKTLEFLFSTQPALEQFTLSPMTPISIEARDGMKLHGYLTLPAGMSPRKLPMVLFVHGGPWTRDSWGLNPTVQWLANRGYGVLQLNFRGSTGYGKSYVNAGNKEWGNKMHHDLLDAKQWAIQKGYADADKIAIYGGSYGGYATLAALAFTPDEFCCGVDIVGPSNLLTLLQTIPPYWGPLSAQMDRQLGNLEKDADFLKERSPYFKAHLIKKPLLIAQGANDPRVKQAESDQIVQAMRQNKLAVEYLLFTDEGHGFARPENRMKFMAATEAFLNKYLGGRKEEPSEKENWEMHRK